MSSQPKPQVNIDLPGTGAKTVLNLGQSIPPIEYTLYYRAGRATQTESLRFNFPSSDMKLVVERAKHHCEVMSYRFVQVKPSMTDLDRAENVLLNRGND